MRLTLVHSALPERKRRWGHPALSRPSVSDRKLLAATYTPNQLRLHYSQVRGLVKPLRRRNSFRIVPAKPEAAGWLAVCHRRTTRMVARQPASPLATGGFRYKKLEPTFGFEPKTCCLRNSCSTTELRWPRAAIVRNRFPPSTPIRWRPSQIPNGRARSAFVRWASPSIVGVAVNVAVRTPNHDGPSIYP